MSNQPTVTKDDEVILRVENLTVQYVLEREIVEAVNDVSLSVASGRTIGIVGETGAGKTTTALAIMNLISDPPGVIKSGNIKVCGKEILKMSPSQLEKVRGKEISMIFQDPMTSLNPVMTVGEQIAESVSIHEKCSKAKALERANEMLELVGIPAERAGEYPHQFSGGMKQRVLIAIALACNPQVLIADEPTTALDVTIQAQVLDLMNDLKRKMGTALIMITHDLGVVAELCDDVAIMYAGRILETGTLEDIFDSMMHPYTEGLFNSLPNIKERKSELVPIPGLMPDPTRLPKGCPFEPRCKYRLESCKETMPSLTQISETHRVSCLAYNDPSFLIERRKNNG